MDQQCSLLEQRVRRAGEQLNGQGLAGPVESLWLQRRLASWAARYELVAPGGEAEKAAQIRVAELAASAFEPAGAEAAELGGRLVLWLFLFDDAFGEGEKFRGSKEHFAAVDPFRWLARGVGRASADCGFQRSLEDWLRAARGRASSEWAFRFGLDLCGYFDGCLGELPLRRLQRPLSVSRYRELRAATVGTRPVFAVIELGLGELGLRQALRADVIALRKQAALLTAWVNDLYSFPKESAARDPLNLVAALAHQERLAGHDAVQRLVEIYNAELEGFEALARRVGRSPSPALRGYVRALRHWVHANRWWTQHCGRYAESRGPQAGQADERVSFRSPEEQASL